MNNRISSPWSLFPMPSSGLGPFFSEPGADLGSIAGTDPSFFLTPQRPNQVGQPEEAFNGSIFNAAQRQLLSDAQRMKPVPRLGPWAALPGVAEGIAAMFETPRGKRR